MKTKSLLNYAGCNRKNASLPGRLLAGCDHVGVGFSGGFPELPHIKARQRIANDLNRHARNLAAVVGSDDLYLKLKSILSNQIYHPDTLGEAQQRCVAREKLPFDVGSFPDVQWAADYAITSWMGRGGQCGTAGEFKGGLSVRFEAGGGGSSVRYWSFVDSLDEWHAALRGWEFTALDIFTFLDKCYDKDGFGQYHDPPWYGYDFADAYKHTFPESSHRKLAEAMNSYSKTRVIMRYGDVPLIRQLYPEGKWHYKSLSTRNQGNQVVQEIILTNFALPAEMVVEARAA
jgi:hypothetical protein